NDGIDDFTEVGGDPTMPLDDDNDGLINASDLDSDADEILDEHEAGPDVADSGPVDTDGDGTPDYRDDDSDGDGILDKDEDDGVLATFPIDTDNDGTPNYLDLDSDDDGI